MTHARRCLNACKALFILHADAAAVPIPELRVWLAELEAALDAEPEREIEAMGERTQIERNDYGFPTEMTSGR